MNLPIFRYPFMSEGFDRFSEEILGKVRLFYDRIKAFGKHLSIYDIWLVIFECFFSI